MPKVKVGGKTQAFPYTAKGRADAKKAAADCPPMKGKRANPFAKKGGKK